MQLCCIEDPSDVVSLNLTGKDLNHVSFELLKTISCKHENEMVIPL